MEFKALRRQVHDFDKHFPDKREIRLTDAQEYLESALGVSVSSEHVRRFLRDKGYKHISESGNEVLGRVEQPNSRNASASTDIPAGYDDAFDDDLDLEDIINLDWTPRRTSVDLDDDTDFSNNRILLEEYVRDGDALLFETLVVTNRRLVHKLANYYARIDGHNLTEDDLEQAGTIGLMQAIQKYNPAQGTTLSTYALYWIRQSIARTIVNEGFMIRVPVHMQDLIHKIRRIEARHMIEEQRLDPEAICQQLGISIERYWRAKQVETQFLQMSSLDILVGEDGDTELNDFISPGSQMHITERPSECYDPALLCVISDIEERVRDLVNTELKPREAQVIRQRYGLDDGEFKTLEQVGNSMGVTRERIRQIEKKALKRLRRKLKGGALEHLMPNPYDGGWS